MSVERGRRRRSLVGLLLLLLLLLGLLLLLLLNLLLLSLLVLLLLLLHMLSALGRKPGDVAQHLCVTDCIDVWRDGAVAIGSSKYFVGTDKHIGIQ